MRIETRIAEIGPAPSGGGKLAGYAAKFGRESGVLTEPNFNRGDPFVEVIRAGAFARSLRENDVRALYNHDTNHVLGRTKSGTLRLSEDSIGLRFELDLPDTGAGRDVREMVARGDIDGCSFGFNVVEDEVSVRDDGTTLRTLVEVDLHEVSPAVAWPAYESSEVALRARARGREPSTPRLALARRKLQLLKLRGGRPR